mmetsp:Transcript_18183/g.55731  ORF Transcript_18183/g.55731 Transcript_18183/m.55731 type:complete len:789 (-) Transcript_18183:529-2895(-)
MVVARMFKEPSPLGLPMFEAFPDWKFLHMKFNPYVSAAAAAVIWGFVGFTVDWEGAAYNEFTDWSAWITDEWSWLYVGSQDIWVVVLMYLLFSKYSKVKLGRDDEQPEFSNLSWFSMLFAAGVGVGLFYYGISEPIFHYTSSGTRWAHFNDNDRAQHALMVTYFHWGVHGWIPYTTIGALLAIMSYRRGYPMTIRSCFVPLLGDNVLRGIFGDFIDVLSIMATLFGVCTSLGLGVQQLNQCLVRLDKGTYAGTNSREEGRTGIEFSTRAQVVIIWVVTACATCSVVSGLKAGIQFLSNVTFAAGCFMLLAVLFMDDTVVILNSITSSFGYYLWYLPKIAWHTDAWEMADDNGAPDGQGGGPEWLGWWTIFYWGWWISWAPFVGTFIAKISRGRTLGEFIAGTLIIPTAYCILWFGTLGSAGILKERQGQQAGLTCDKGNTFSELRSTRLGEDGWAAEHNTAYDFRLSCLDLEDELFDTMSSYGTRTMGYFTSTFVGVLLLMYFVTSSDSGSLVIDSLAANGEEDPPILQRVFWACTEGAAAHALLKTGKDKALRALQSVSIVSGLPYTFVLCFMCAALLNVAMEEFGDLDVNRNKFRNGLLAPLTYVFDEKEGGAAGGLCNLLLNCTCPWYAVLKVQRKIRGIRGTPGPRCLDVKVVGTAFLYYAAVAFLCLSPVQANLRMISAATYLFFCGAVATVRLDTRTVINCERGSLVSDYITAVLCFPLVLSHCNVELAYGPILATVAKTDEIKSLVPADKEEAKDDVELTGAPVVVVDNEEGDDDEAEEEV